jgi:hypothetical protein
MRRVKAKIYVGNSPLLAGLPMLVANLGFQVEDGQGADRLAGSSFDPKRTYKRLQLRTAHGPLGDIRAAIESAVATL